MNLYFTTHSKQTMVFTGVQESDIEQLEQKACQNIGNAYSIYSFTDMYRKNTFSLLKNTADTVVSVN